MSKTIAERIAFAEHKHYQTHPYAATRIYMGRDSYKDLMLYARPWLITQEDDLKGAKRAKFRGMEIFWVYDDRDHLHVC